MIDKNQNAFMVQFWVVMKYDYYGVGVVSSAGFTVLCTEFVQVMERC